MKRVSALVSLYRTLRTDLPTDRFTNKRRDSRFADWNATATSSMEERTLEPSVRPSDATRAG